jgi:hypothetical protein
VKYILIVEHFWRNEHEIADDGDSNLNWIEEINLALIILNLFDDLNKICEIKEIRLTYKENNFQKIN